MTAWARIAGQLGVTIALMAAVAQLSDWPRYHQIAANTAIIRLSFTHGSNRQAECRRRTPEELAKLPPNMRKPLECPRRRGAVYVEFDLDGQTVYRASLPPSGISGDGPARAYQRFVVPAGPHAIAMRMRDTPRTEGFDYVKSSDVVLAADANLVIDFSTDAQGFVIR
ncbi:MAG: hypothetical protein F9K29_10050 [Hyphomicrobiaceae bacterium]|nr:MAG: hypothetical protein F9K29_10050 [Hyphomicrobiaceae bacterium]